MNVTITRAKFSLFVLGHLRTLKVTYTHIHLTVSKKCRCFVFFNETCFCRSKAIGERWSKTPEDVGLLSRHASEISVMTPRRFLNGKRHLAVYLILLLTGLALWPHQPITPSWKLVLPPLHDPTWVGVHRGSTSSLVQSLYLWTALETNEVV